MAFKKIPIRNIPVNFDAEERSRLLENLGIGKWEKQDMTRTEMLPIDRIVPLRSFEHPFEKSLENDIEELAESIKRNGLWQPIVVREFEDEEDDYEERYEILSGHRRTMAAKIAGLTEIPANIVECDDEVAKLIVTETNTCQREEIYPSEKGKAYKMQLEALKEIANKPCNFNDYEEENANYSPGVVAKNNKYSVDLVAENAGESREQVRRYIRLLELNPLLLEMVDNKVLALKAGVALSYLRKDEQAALAYILETNEGFTLKVELAEFLKAASKERELTEEDIQDILFPKKEKKEKEAYKKAMSGVEKYIKKYKKKNEESYKRIDAKELEDVITKAIEQYLNEL